MLLCVRKWYIFCTTKSGDEFTVLTTAGRETSPTVSIIYVLPILHCFGDKLSH